MTSNEQVPGEQLSEAGWSLLSRYTHVLICVAENPSIRMRDIAEILGITERSVQKIILSLEQADVVGREKVGRNNRYSLNTEASLPHPIEAKLRLNEVLQFVLDARRGGNGPGGGL